MPLEARALLEYIAGTYCAMQAYFAAMYYAGLRPAEARNIRKRDLHLPTGGWANSSSTGRSNSSRVSGPIAAVTAKRGASNTALKVIGARFP
jgi:integrase